MNNYFNIPYSQTLVVIKKVKLTMRVSHSKILKFLYKIYHLYKMFIRGI
jgi:hypothetical protein